MKKVAIMYDFDGTLSPQNMQEFDFIPGLGMKTNEFWQQVGEISKNQQADQILAYMKHMIDKANEKEIQVHRKDIKKYGNNIQLFSGVEEWFDRINKYGKENNLAIEHYIISSGLKEMIEGTKIAKHFTKIYASSFMYNHYDIAVWPALALNYTSKTQFIFRINKGVFEVHDNSTINDYIPEDTRLIPFKRMIYIGDGLTDVPCMKLVNTKGGYSIAVYKKGNRNSKQNAIKLIEEDRVNYISVADYSEHSDLDKIVKHIIDNMATDVKLSHYKPSKKPETIKVNKDDITNNIFDVAFSSIKNPDEFHWHKYAHQSNSSQAVAIDVFGTIKESKYKDEIINEICQQISITPSINWDIEFEYEPPKNILNESKSSQIDVKIESGKSTLIIECKFTENDGGGCSQINKIACGEHKGIIQCNGNYELQTNLVNGIQSKCALTGKSIKYWDYIPNVFTINPSSDYKPCPFNNGTYQFMRNLCIVDYLKQTKESKFIIVYAESDKLHISKMVKNNTIFKNFIPIQDYYSFLTYQEIIDIGLKVTKNDKSEHEIWNRLKAHFENKLVSLQLM